MRGRTPYTGGGDLNGGYIWGEAPDGCSTMKSIVSMASACGYILGEAPTVAAVANERRDGKMKGGMEICRGGGRFPSLFRHGFILKEKHLFKEYPAIIASLFFI